MSAGNVSWLLLAIAVVLANIPWLQERFLLFFKPGRKPLWMCLTEWLAMYFLAGGLALGVERKTQGELHPQEWEFYVVTFFLFIIFAFPGVIYRYLGQPGPAP